MKKQILLLLISFSILTISFAQNLPCNPSFTFSVNPFTKLVTFTNTSTGNNLHYTWNFDDGSSSTLANPTKTFTSFGTHYTCLTVYRTDTPCQKIACQNVVIVNPCDASWTVSSDSVNHLKQYFKPIALANSGSLGYYYQWTFGDGTGSTSVTPDHIYSNPGRYKVCLKITRMDSACTNTLCDSITVNPNTTVNPCNANWTVKSDSINHLKQYFVSTASLLMSPIAYYYYWTFGDGVALNSTSTNGAPDHTYLTPGKYKVCLKITRMDSACTNTICDSINVLSNTITPCNATWSYQQDPITKTKIYFNPTLNSNDYYYFWSFGDGSSSLDKLPAHVYNANGKYTVCLKLYKKDSTSSCYKCDTLNITSPSTTNCNAMWTAQTDSLNKLLWTFKPKYPVSGNSSANTVSYVWTFGDGTTFSGMNASHLFTKSGKYYVCLKVTRYDSSCTSTWCDSITVTANTSACVATWTYKADPTSVNKIYFTPTLSSNDYYYYWSFGDNTYSLDKAPVHTYTSTTANKFWVCLKLMKKDSSTYCLKCDSVKVSPVVVNCSAAWATTVDSLNKLKWFFKPTSALPINSATAYYYLWTFGDGATSTSPNPDHVYLTAGKYKVCLKVTRYDSTCTSTICDTLVISNSPTPCIATWVYKADYTISGKIYFTPTLSSNDYYYKWTFGDGTSSADKAPAHTYNAMHKYYVCLKLMKKDSSTSCMKCDSVSTLSITPCSANWTSTADSVNHLKWNFNANVSPISSNGTTTSYIYSWTFGDGTTSNLKSPIHTYTQAGRYKVCLKAIRYDSTLACEKCDSITVLSNTSCVANFAYTVNSNGTEFHFSNTSSGSYTSVKWTFGDGSTSTTNSPVHLYTANGTYTVCLFIYRIVNNDTLCSSHKCMNISVVANSSTNICIASFTFAINSITRKVEFVNKSTGQNLAYYWTFGDTSSSTLKNPSHTYLHNGTYHVCLKVVNLQDTLCASTLCVNVPVYSPILNPPIAPANFNYIVNDPSLNTVQFNHLFANNAMQFTWDFGDGTQSNDQNPIHSFNDKNWYLVCFTVSDENGSDTQCQNIYPDNTNETTGVKPIVKANNLHVYPNPFTQEINIDFYNPTLDNYDIMISDLSGRLVYTQKVKVESGQQHLNISSEHIQSGMYILQMISANNKMMQRICK